MKDPNTGEMILDTEHLKKAALDYCYKLLQNDIIDPDYEVEINIDTVLHNQRLSQTNNHEVTLEYEDFEARLKHVAQNSGDKYTFLLKAGQDFRNCVYQLFSKVWETEEISQQCRKTVIVQLYKMKGDITSFDSQRNIHTKQFIPKLFEGLVVDKSKEKIIASLSKFQIGGIPNHRSQEHLFCVNSVIQLYSKLNITLYIQVFDIAKYFDKENLKDAMDTLFQCGINGKLYRLWYALYRESIIRVKTAAGLTNEKSSGENVTQGSIGGAILSFANLDKTMSAYFNGSNSEINYGDVRLSVLTFQDDALRMVDTLQKAQHGNELMSSAMKRKQLTLNIDKCSIIVFGKKAKVESIRNKINRDKSLTLDDKIVKAKEKDEYLGDMLHEAGLAMSAHETVNKRCGKMFSSIIEISSILDDFRIDSLGGLKAGLDIFDLALIPTLHNNADTWVDLKEDTIQKLENLQNTMFRYLFAVPKSTPQPIMRFDLGHLSMREKFM